MAAQTSKKLTRRNLVKTVAFATAGAGLLAGAGLANASDKDQQACCGDRPLPDESVFTTICNDKSADKYRHGDNPVVYRLGALWLMLVTEDWTDYFRDPANKNTESAWIAGLASELKLDLADVQRLWDVSKLKADSFKDIRASWKNFTSNTSKYGARPCHGGQSILNIACLDKS
jgi:hypothetical protein